MRISETWESARDWLEGRSRSLLIMVLVALLSAFLVQNPFKLNVPSYKEGDIARADIKAPEPILATDEELTESKRALAAQTVMRVYDLDAQSNSQNAKRLRDAFRYMRQQKAPYSFNHFEEFKRILDADISQEEWQVLKKNRFSRGIQSTLQSLIRIPGSRWIIQSQLDSPLNQSQVIIRNLRTGEEQEVSFDELRKKTTPIKEVSALIASPKIQLNTLWRQMPPNDRATVIALASRIVDINLVYNQVETEARREEVRAKVEPISIEVSRGEMIVRDGEKVNREQVLLLNALGDLVHGRTSFVSFFGFSLLLLFLMSVFYSIGSKNFRKFRLSSRDQMTIGGFFVGSLGLIVALQALYAAAEVQSLSGTSLILLLPIAFTGMTLRLFASMEITTFFVFLFGVCISWLLQDPFMGLVTVVAALSGAAKMRHIMQRLDVFRAGTVAGLSQALIVLVGLLLNFTDHPVSGSIWINALAVAGFSLASGLLSSFLVLGVQPIIEKIGYTTDLRLMELSNTNHPLLRDMIIKAPGTYFHSFTVSQLAEKAAEAINANALFARVSSLYHDIGKTKKAMYFIENIKGENKHDKLVPTMSALIIANHVKEGIELGQKYKLPQSIIEVIPQHHGTSLISYFHEKAKKQLKEGEKVDDKEFRYPGPKPQTKEAGIIMLADAAEAAAKSLKDPSEAKLREVVGKIINRFFLEGQLDECELSLKDLNAIGNAFIQVLKGIYHQRIDYPHMNQPKTESDDKTKSAISRISRAAHQEG